MSVQLTDADIPRLLIARGWKQGAVFRASGVEFWCAEAEATASSELFVARSRATPSDGRFVVVSQTCDISASLDREPVVEALACAPEPNSGRRAGYRRSFRWFEIDRGTGLVAHAMYRLPFDKRALLRVTPERWPDTPERLEAFSRWLGRRSYRAAIPTPIVDAFVKPLSKVLDRLEDRHSTIFEAFNSAVEEIRIRMPAREEPPFEISMVLLLDEDGLSKEGDDAIERVCRDIRAKLKADQAHLGEVLKLTRSRMSVELYFATSLVDFDAMTYEGDEIVGAEPPPPA